MVRILELQTLLAGRILCTLLVALDLHQGKA